MAVVIETTLGDITVDLYVKERPRACLNFIKLCKLKYYNYNLFHTIEQGFIAQTGDPSGNGDGGQSIWGVIEGLHKRFFEPEYIPKIKHTEPGLLSLVSTGKEMVGSQFFFTLGSDLTSLDGIHCVIGEVVEGLEVLRKINEAICDESHRPYQDIRVTHTVIIEDPFENPRGFREPSRSPSPTPERMRNGRIGADEQIDDTEGKTEIEIHEMLAEREAKARATILEIVGDLPDADIAPPENVLFVCKLNPVTTDDCLEIIFSRFGKIVGCEVIRDKITGDSLQYAFVEFDDKKSCEAAYFKMDNVLIDDRRIHVDFSQSVAKLKWRGKGRGIIYEDSHDANKKLDFTKGGKTNHRNYEDNRNRRPEFQNKERRDYNNFNQQRSRSPKPSASRSQYGQRNYNRVDEDRLNKYDRKRVSRSRSRSPVQVKQKYDKYEKSRDQRSRSRDTRKSGSRDRTPKKSSKHKKEKKSHKKKRKRSSS